MNRNDGLQFNRIVLNGERDRDIIHDLLTPTREQLKNRDEFIASITDDIIIHDDMSFEIKGVDLVSPRDIVPENFDINEEFIVSPELNLWFSNGRSERSSRTIVEIYDDRFSTCENVESVTIAA